MYCVNVLRHCCGRLLLGFQPLWLTQLCSNQDTASYKTVGRIGAGILGNKLVRQFNIIFYYTPQKVLALCPISEEMELVVQNEVYVNFTDDKRQQWSVQFASAEALQTFLMHYAVARISLNASSAFQMDLQSGTGSVRLVHPFPLPRNYFLPS